MPQTRKSTHRSQDRAAASSAGHERPDATYHAGSRLVVVGASAGGIEALSQLVAGLPPDFAAPIVIAQHLDPRRPSHLAEILGRRTLLPVRQVDEQADLDNGVIHVIPSNRHVEVTDSHIRLRLRKRNESAPSVDRLFSSAAARFGPGLVAVVLTGSGSDGAVGARAVKAAGGTVVIEDPATAAFPSMPESLPPAIVDVVAQLGSMGPLLHQLTSRDLSDGSIDRAAMDQFLEAVRQRSGIDFSTYKRPTIHRRLQTRMSATRTASLAEYAALVERDSQEYERLVRSFLIKVTEFFRDPALWEYLRVDVLPGLVATARAEQRELRLWSAGCSTGEEAFSLALVAAEALGGEGLPDGLRVFATDVDSEAIAFGRRGTYLTSALTDIPTPLRDRYFAASDGRSEVAKEIRDAVVFGLNDLGGRSPFPRIDLVLCRNVLIYFTPEMQRGALETFGLALRSGGYLVLGQSETTSVLPEPFSDVNARLKVYRRTSGSAHLPKAGRPTGGGPAIVRRADVALERAVGVTRRDADRDARSASAAEAILLDLALGVVIVDRRYDVLRINTAARRLLGIHGTAFGQDFIHLAESLRSNPLREAIDDAMRGRSVSDVHSLDGDEPGDEGRWLRITASPYSAADQPAGALLQIIDVTAEQRDRAERRRLANLNRRLLRDNEELTHAIAEVRSANEAMLSSSEDAQSTREEVETLNEEMQATNEELETVNEELTASVEELTLTNDELQVRTDELATEHRRSEERRSRLEAVLTSLGDGVIAVDRDGVPVATNPAYERMFGGTAADFEPFDPTGIPLPREAWPQRRAAAGENFAMDFMVQDPTGERRWFEAVAEPLTTEDRIWGGVVTIRDVTERTVRALLEEVLAAASHELRTPVAALHGYVQLIERQLTRGDVAEATRYAANATAQTERLGRLVDRLFDVSRIRSGRLELNTRPVNLGVVVEQAVEVGRGLADAPRFGFTTVARLPRVVADPDRIVQVVVILLANAIEHAGSSDSIDVRVSRAGETAVVSVSDHGQGIAAEDLPGLFDPFARMILPDAGRAGRGHGGLGLGLFIARRIALAHGGDLTVESTAGAGSRFSLLLPLHGAARRARVTGAQRGQV